MLAEVTTTAISKTQNPQSMAENIEVAKRGGNVAKVAKDSFEKETGQQVTSKLNVTTKELLEIEPTKNKSNNEL